jgi:hypothetical protein
MPASSHYDFKLVRNAAITEEIASIDVPPDLVHRKVWLFLQFDFPQENRQTWLQFNNGSADVLRLPALFTGNRYPASDRVTQIGIASTARDQMNADETLYAFPQTSSLSSVERERGAFSSFLNFAEDGDRMFYRATPFDITLACGAVSLVTNQPASYTRDGNPKTPKVWAFLAVLSTQFPL